MIKNENRQPSYYKTSWTSSGDRFWRCPVEASLFEFPVMTYMSGFSQWKEGRYYARKNSHTFSVELVVSGDARYVQNRRSYLVKPGQVFLVHKDCDNRFETGPSGYLLKRMVMLEGTALKIILQSQGLLDIDVLTCRDPSRIIQLIKQVNRLMGSGEADIAWRLSCLAYEILLELGRKGVQSHYSPEVTNAIRFMSNNINRSLTLDEIAKISGLSMFHFARQFQKSLRCPPMTFFFRQKMALAKSLLKDSGLLVKEIALVLGYEDPFYFSAQFRKFTGMSPREFRAKSDEKI